MLAAVAFVASEEAETDERAADGAASRDAASEFSPDEAPSKPSQKWDVTVNADQTITIKQGSLCVDNNFMVEPPPS